jgi:hypothetical protein
LYNLLYTHTRIHKYIYICIYIYIYCIIFYIRIHVYINTYIYVDPVLLRLSNPSPLRNKKLFPDILYDLGIVDIDGKADLSILEEDINLFQSPRTSSGINSSNGGQYSTHNNNNNNNNTFSKDGLYRSRSHSNSNSNSSSIGYLGGLDNDMLARLSEGNISNYLRVKLLLLQIRNGLVFTCSVLYMVAVKAYNFFAMSLGLWNRCDDSDQTERISASRTSGGKQ